MLKKNNIFHDDKTPENYAFKAVDKNESLKKIFRKYGYPFYRELSHHYCKLKLSGIGTVKADYWLYGYRGNDYDFLRAKVNKVKTIRNKTILVAGCGTGKDIPSWLEYGPKKIIGIDYFSYEKAWEEQTRKYKEIFPNTEVEFYQGNLESLSDTYVNCIDLICSDAVLEHVTDLKKVTNEFYIALKEGGLLYSTYGPLWYCWGGDHVSGWDSISNGYNHLLLNDKEYKEYLEEKGAYLHDEDDGRTWINNGLFSYLKPKGYLDIFENSKFVKEMLGCIVDPRAVECLSKNDNIKKILLKDNEYIDLVVSSMSIIYRKTKL